MKKNIPGILAIMLAIGFSAFSTKRSIVYFDYIPPGGSFSQINVEDESRWVRVDGPDIRCDVDNDEIACTIGIESSYLENLAAGNLDLADTNNDLFIKGNPTFFDPSKVIDVKQFNSISIDPIIYNDLEF